MTRSQLAAGLALALVAIALLGVRAAAPRVAGHRVRAGVTVRQALETLGGVRQFSGSLLAADGSVLTPGGGRRPTVLVGGALASLDQAVRWGQRAEVYPGQDVTEPLREVVHHTTGPRGQAVTVRYVQGKASGKRVALERVALVAPKVVQVALTFDDGPTPAYTPRVLSALAKYGAHATFFVLGDMASHWPGLVRREAAGGNEVCIHTWNHPMMTRVSAARLDAEVLRSARLVAHLAGTARWFRPPYGGINAHVRARVAALGFHTVLWDVDTSDWRKPPPSTIAARIVNGARNGRVILMHDGGGDRSRTVAALAIALPRLRARGVRMVTLSQLRGLVPAPPTTVLVADAQGKAAYALAALTVVVNGRELAPAPLAARREGHLLLAAKPVLHALGVPLAWDAGAEALVVDSMHGRAVVRANSRRLTLDGREVLLTAPALRVEGQVLAPVGLLAQLGNAVVSLRPGGGPVTFDAVARPTDDGAPRPGQAPPAGAGLVPRADGLVPH